MKVCGHDVSREKYMYGGELRYVCDDCGLKSQHVVDFDMYSCDIHRGR